MDDSTSNLQPSSASASPLGQTSSATQPKQHLFSSFSPSFNFYENNFMDANDENSSDLSQVTSLDSEAELISGMRDVTLDKPKSSRFTWLEPQSEPEQSASPLAPQLPFGSLVQPEDRRGSPQLDQNHQRSSSRPGTPVPSTPPKFDLLHPGIGKSANASSVFSAGPTTPMETPNRTWSRDSSEGAGVESYGHRRVPSRSSPSLARSLFTPPFTPRTYNRSNLSEDTPPPQSASLLQDLFAGSVDTTIQNEGDFPLNDLEEALKAVSLDTETSGNRQKPQASKPTRIIIMEGVDEDLAFDELREALMGHGEIRHLSIVSTTCICVYYNIGAAIAAYNHIQQYGLAHQSQVGVSYGTQPTVKKYGPVPEDLLMNQGALILWNHVGLNVLAMMSKFGEIKSIEEHDLCPAEAVVVEFNDTRCAKRASDYIQQYHGDSLFVEFKNPMRKTWNPATRDVTPPPASNQPVYFSPSLLDLELEPVFSMSPSHANNERRFGSPLISDLRNETAFSDDNMLLSTPERDDNSSNMVTPRRPSRPKVPSIVTTFGLDDSPRSQRQQQIQQLQHESGRGIDSPLYVGSSPVNHGGIIDRHQVASPTSHLNAKATFEASGVSDILFHSSPIDIYGRKRGNTGGFSSARSPLYNNNSGRSRLFPTSSLDFSSPSAMSSSPFGLLAMNESLWSHSNNSNSNPLLLSKLQQFQQKPLSSTAPLSAPITSTPMWHKRHSSNDSPISPLMASPLHGSVLGSSPLVTSGTLPGIMSSGHNIKTGDFDLARVVAGLDNRTTFMIKNLPNKYTQQMLIDFLNETHRGEFDFLYVRIDFINRCNVGYAFINFANPASVISFAERVVGKRWPKFNSTKVCTLSYAKIQGLDALIRKFRDSSVMLEEPAFRPKIFYTSGPNKGEEAPFPSPTIPLRPSTRGLYSKTHGYIHGNEGMMIGNTIESPVVTSFNVLRTEASHILHSSSTSMTVKSGASNHSSSGNSHMDIMEDDEDEILASRLVNSTTSSLSLFDETN